MSNFQNFINFGLSGAISFHAFDISERSIFSAHFLENFLFDTFPTNLTACRKFSSSTFGNKTTIFSFIFIIRFFCFSLYVLDTSISYLILFTSVSSETKLSIFQLFVSVSSATFNWFIANASSVSPN